MAALKRWVYSKTILFLKAVLTLLLPRKVWLGCNCKSGNMYAQIFRAAVCGVRWLEIQTGVTVLPVLFAVL